MLGLIAGGLAGALVGIGCGLIPSLGAQHVVLGASVIGGLVGGVAGATAATVVGQAVYSIVGSAKEAIDPELSGSPEMLAAAPESVVDAKQTGDSLVVSKVIGTVFGIGLAAFLGQILFPLTTLPITPIVALLVVILLWSVFKRHWLITIAYLLLTQGIFHVAGGFGISNIVYVVGSCVFLIPGCLQALTKKDDREDQSAPSNLQFEGTAKRLLLPDPIKMFLSAAIASLTPGVNTALVTTATTRKGNVITQLTTAAAEAAVEGMGLMALIMGVQSGKSSLGLELAVGYVGLEVLALYIVGLIIGLIYYRWVYREYRQVSQLPGIHLIGLGLAVGTVLLNAGLFWGPVLIAVGLVTRLVMRLTGAPSTLLSITFLGPCL